MSSPDQHIIEKKGKSIYSYIVIFELFLLLLFIGVYIQDLNGLQKKARIALRSAKYKLATANELGFESEGLNTSLLELDRELEGSVLYIFPSKYKKIISDSNTIALRIESEYLFNLNAQKKQFSLKIANLKTNLIASDPYDIPSRTEFEKEITGLEQATASANMNLLTINRYHEKVDVLEKKIAEEIEVKKREQILSQVMASQNEVELMTTFFSLRPGYETEKSNLEQFKQKAAELNTNKYKNTNSKMLSAILQHSLYPLLDLPRKTKARVEEEEYQKYLAEEKQKQKERGIPDAPIGTGKVVLVAISSQRLYAYENGVSLFSDPIKVTTGMRGFDTVTGQFAVYDKQTHFRMRSPFPGIFYDNYVDFWMPFFEGYGLHDAAWRSVYGTMDYPAIGSHGCVNIPYNEVARLYGWVDVGTPVIVR